MMRDPVRDPVRDPMRKRQDGVQTMVMDGWTPTDDRATPQAALRRIARWDGMAAQYDDYRPSAPTLIPALLSQLAATSRPTLVVDLGSGTGLSTRLWAGRAGQVVGVEPNDEMRAQAERRLRQAAAGDEPDATAIRFVAGRSEQTGLPDACADIVTVAQALHWMEPVATLAEVARILRPGGVFAAYDYDWPFTVTWETEQLYNSFMERVWEVATARGVFVDPPGWKKSEHLERMRASGHFRQVKEMTLSDVRQGDAEAFIGLALSNVVVELLARGQVTAEEIGLAEFERAVRAALPEGPVPFYVSYCVRLALK